MHPLRGLVLLLIVLLGTAAPAVAAEEPEPSADTVALANRYAPYVVAPEHNGCNVGEPYQPTAVTDVLGNPDVVLDLPDGQRITAPTAQNLADAPADSYVNYPGQPLNPGCSYDSWAAKASANTSPTLYAHVATDPNYPGELALQYWFFYLYNDWNDRHEGDWEMVQLRFDAATPGEALRSSPLSVAYAQHEGSEVADWDAAKLIKDGDHIVVYPAVGSHAAYFGQSQWFGKSAASGFGCDDTSVTPVTPGGLIEPQIVVTPDTPLASDPQFAWLTYQGRWGEKAPSFNNGPTGPNTKTQWTEPITWQVDEGRDGAVAIPRIPGPAVTAFCAVTAQGSLLFMKTLDQPVLVVLLASLLLAAVLLLVRATKWRGADVTSYDRERRAGQILDASLTIYGRRIGIFAVIGAIFLAGALLTAAIDDIVLSFSGSGGITDLNGATNPVPEVLAAVGSLAIRGPIVVIVVASAIAVAARPHGVVGLREALRRSVSPPSTAYVLAGSYLVILSLSATVLLLPVALWLAARWSSAGPAAMVEGLSPRAALTRSRHLTKQKSLRTLALTLFLFLLIGLPGIVLGAVLLLVVSWPFWVVNMLVGVTFAVMLPLFGIALTLQFYDLRAEQVRDAKPAPVASPRDA